MEWLFIGLMAGAVGWFVMRRFIGGASIEEVQAALDAGAVLVDVRSSGEFQGGTLKGARNIPMGQPPRGLDKNTPVVVFCRSGARSSGVARSWRSQGFTVLDLGSMGSGSGLKL